MPVDWSDLDIDSVIVQSAKQTDQKLASKISSLTRMTDSEIQELFPNPADIQKLTKLMKIVKSAEDQNVKIVKISENIQEFSGVICTLLYKLV